MHNKSELLIISRVNRPGKIDRHWVVRKENAELEMFVENMKFNGAIVAICNTYQEAAQTAANLA